MQFAIIASIAVYSQIASASPINKRGFCVMDCVEGTHCVDGACVATTTPCVIDCLDGYYCDNTTMGQCVQKKGIHCVADCIDGYYCDNTTAGLCVPKPEPVEKHCVMDCVQGTHCDGTTGACVANTCPDSCPEFYWCDASYTKGECWQIE